MNLFAIAGLSCGISCLILAFIAVFFGKTKAHRLLVFFNIAVATWGFGGFFVGISKTPEVAIFAWKFAHIGGAFVAVFFYHLICEFCRVKHNTPLLIFGYSQAIVFNAISWGLNIAITEVRYVYNLYYNVANFFVAFIISAYLLFIILSFRELINLYKKSSGNVRVQAVYVMLGFAIGFVGGTSTFMPEFKIDLIYPFGNLGIVIYCIIVTYAILKYNILDIKIAITRVGVFIVVYSIILGIPFWIGLKYYGKGDWLLPTSICAVLATVCPFVFLYIQRRAEESLLQKERDSHALIEEASSEMTRIKELQKVLKLTVDLVKILEFKRSSLFLLDRSGDKYELRASNPELDQKILIDNNDSLVKRLRTKKVALVYDELKTNHEGSSDPESIKLLSCMNELSAKAIMPIMIKEHLLGFLVLGDRDSNGVFTPDLIRTLTTFCNQAALGIENAMIYAESEKSLTEMFQDSKQKTIGNLASGVAHQFNNRYNSMVIATIMIHKLLQNRKLSEISDDEHEQLMEFLKQIETDALLGSEIASAILSYSKADTQSRVIDFGTVVKASLKVFFIERRNIEHMFSYDYAEELLMWTNFALMQDIIKTGADNSVDAIKIKQNKIERGEVIEEGFAPKIIIRAKSSKKDLIIELEDNGIGLTKEELDTKIFTPFFTTKGAKKGTGLGIPMMRKLVEQCGGTIRYESEHTKWTKLIITMPLATEEQIKKDRDDKDWKK